MDHKGSQAMSAMKASAAALLVTAFLASEANATEVAYFSHSLIVQSETTYSPAYSNTTNRYKDTQFGAQASHASMAVTNGYGSQQALAQSSLSAGELKAGAWADQMTLAPGAGVSLSSIAAFGDSFSLTGSGGGPFAAAGSLAAFSMSVSGQGRADGGTASRSPSATAYLELFILSPGALDRWKPNAFGGFPIHVADIVQVFQWGATPGSTHAMDYSTYGSTYDVHEIAVLEDGDVAVAQFQPPAEFDWLVRLSVGVSLFSGDQDAYAYSDFSHTVDMSFEGPTGSTTWSASGLFPGTVGIPSTVSEPPIMALLPCLMVLAACRRPPRLRGAAA
jgi:hypothetical protein